jgi:UDP-2,3-diacylglucosamine pyrophosphatase LpxH
MQPRHIFVISDLHLGGEPSSDRSVGFQMCPPRARRRLARFIDWVAKAPAPKNENDPITELVINGDFLDFLAEQPFKPFTPGQAAVDKLHQAISNIDSDISQEERVFEALHRLVDRGHNLTILIGNHDVELSLPPVRRALQDKITQGKPARIEFLYDGEAYVVGDLIIEHGNRYDGWNLVSQGQLRAYRAALSRSEQTVNFVAPPGSFLVTNVMNTLKERYRFIDLLKPENEAVLPILIEAPRFNCAPAACQGERLISPPLRPGYLLVKGECRMNAPHARNTNSIGENSS